MNIMRKLKLYGNKGAIETYLGSILVKGNKLVIEAPESQVRDDLEKLINTLHRDSMGNVYVEAGRKKVMIDDPHFLKVLEKQDFFMQNEETYEYPKFGNYELEPNFSKIVNVISGRGIEKLRLFGEKDKFKGFIATIHVDNSRVVVESENDELRECLLREINEKLQQAGSFRLCWPKTEKKPDGTIVHTDGFKAQRPGDSHFLDALRSEFHEAIGLSVKGRFGNATVCSYKINPLLSELIEE